MTEHFTRNTVSASAYCKRCRSHTQHAVQGGRLGACLTCQERPLPPAPPAPPAPERGLFDEPEEKPR
jgi:hypothetical protein